MVIRKDVFGKYEMNLLQMFKGRLLHKILVDCDFCNNKRPSYVVARYIVFVFDEQLVLLENQVVEEAKDSDDYSSFKLVEIGRDFFDKKRRIMKMCNHFEIFDKYQRIKWCEYVVEQKITDITIFRDQAVWQFNDVWDITTDVSLKIKCRNHKFLFVLQDSIAGFIVINHNYNNCDVKLIDQFWNSQKWGLKADNVSNLNRYEISI